MRDILLTGLNGHVVSRRTWDHSKRPGRADRYSLAMTTTAAAKMMTTTRATTTVDDVDDSGRRWIITSVSIYRIARTNNASTYEKTELSSLERASSCDDVERTRFATHGTPSGPPRDPFSLSLFSLALSLSLSLSPSIFPSFSLSFSPSLSLSPSRSLSFSLSRSFPLFLSSSLSLFTEEEAPFFPLLTPDPVRCPGRISNVTDQACDARTHSAPRTLALFRPAVT